MQLKYTQLPLDAFKKLQINAGVIVKWSGFNPETGALSQSAILGATSGGIEFSTNPEYSDFGEDVDNCPNNTLQMKRLVSVDPTASGTFLTVTPEAAASMAGAADVDGTDTTKIVPRAQLKEEDFVDIGVIGDYSDVNTGADAGYLAIRIKNALNTEGFQLQTTKDEKGTMAFEYHGHYDMDDMDNVPYEIYCKAGSGEGGGGTPAVVLSEHSITIGVDDEYTLSASVRNSSVTVTWASGSSTVATVAGGVVTGKAAGNTIITASITDGGVTYNDTCTVVVE